MSSSANSIVIHCWLPDLNPLAAGCVTGVGAIGTLLGAFVEALSWTSLLLGILGIATMLLWFTYSRVTVTPEQLAVTGCGLFRRPRYASSLAGVALEGCWALSGREVSPEETPVLELYTDWDWDTPDDYVVAKHRGEQITSFFRLSQYAAIREAVATMTSRPLLLANTAATATDDHA